MFFDSHAHLTSPQVMPSIEGILLRAKEAGVESIVNICTDEASLMAGLDLVRKYSWVYNVASTTPHDVDVEGESFFPIVAKLSKEGSLVAIGETGLDYHYEYSSKKTQQEYLRKYLQLAMECNLPVVIHCRDAFNDFFKILDEVYCIKGKHGPGVLHCFTGTIDEAKQVIERGLYLSISGIVTFKKSLDLQEVAKFVNLSQLLIETDTPYLAPGKYRGKPNEPCYIRETASFIASLRGISVEEVAKATRDNAYRLFNP